MKNVILSDFLGWIQSQVFETHKKLPWFAILSFGEPGVSGDKKCSNCFSHRQLDHRLTGQNPAQRKGWWLSHYLWGFNHPKMVSRISSINSISSLELGRDRFGAWSIQNPDKLTGVAIFTYLLENLPGFWSAHVRYQFIWPRVARCFSLFLQMLDGFVYSLRYNELASAEERLGGLGPGGNWGSEGLVKVGCRVVILGFVSLGMDGC